MTAELVRVGAPDGAVHAVRGMSGREYASRDGMYRMTPADAAALRSAGGFAPAIGAPARGGYACRCGFRPLVRLCSRCGHLNDRRTDDHQEGRQA